MPKKLAIPPRGADDRRGKAEALHAEGQLVPHAVRDDLLVWLLQHKADLGGLPPRVQRGKRLAEEGDLARKAAVRRQRGLQRAQQRRFAAAGRANKRENSPSSTENETSCRAETVSCG